MTGHAYKAVHPRRDWCAICGRGSNDPCHTLELFSGSAAGIAEAAAVSEGERLSKELATPKASIENMAGKMEYQAPLFAGKLHPGLF